MRLQISLAVLVTKATKLMSFNTKLAWFTGGAVEWLLEKAAYPALFSDVPVPIFLPALQAQH